MNIPVPGATGQRSLLWIGIVLGAIYWLALILLTDFYPPPAPTLSADAITNHIFESEAKFRLGVVIMLLASGWYLPLFLVIAIQTARLEKGFPFIATLQLLCIPVVGCIWAFPPVMFGVAAFTPDRSPELILLMHDLAWLWWITPGGIYGMQIVCIGLVAFLGKQNDPHTAFPRWLGWLTLIFAIESAVPPTFAQIFKDGPIAWDGLVTWHVTVAGGGIFMIILFYSVFRAIRLQEQAGTLEGTK